MKKYTITLVGFDGPIKTEICYGSSAQEVYTMYGNNYPVKDYPEIKYISVSEVL